MKSSFFRFLLAALLCAALAAVGTTGCGTKSGGQVIRFDNAADYLFSADAVSVSEAGNALAELKRLPDDSFWTVYYKDPRPRHGAEYHRAIVLPDGSILAVGEVTNFQNHSGELLIGKHGTDGQMLPGWPVFYAGDGLRWNEAQDVMVDAAGNITVSGYVITRSEQWRFALWRFDANGNSLPGWPQYPVGSHSYGVSCIADSAGDIVVCGSAGPTGFDSMVLVKYKTDGTLVAGWPKTYKVPKSAENFAYDLLQDADGHLVVAGYTATASKGPRDATLWKLDTSGNLLDGWPKIWDSGMAVFDEYFSITQDAQGDYCLVGTTDGTTEKNGRLMVTALNRQGELLAGWPEVLGGLGWRDASPPDAWRGSGDAGGAIEGAGTYEIDPAEGAPETELPETRVDTVLYGSDGIMAQGFPKRLALPGFFIAARSSVTDQAGNIYVVGWIEPTDGSESDNSTFIAKYPPAAYATGRPGVVTKQGITYTNLRGFSETLGSGNAGSIAYQLSPDGRTWFYFDGSAWREADNVMQANAAAEVDKSIAAFGDQVGGGTLYVKALLVSDGTQPVQLSSLEIKKD